VNKETIIERLKVSLDDDEVLGKVAETMMALGIFDEDNIEDRTIEEHLDNVPIPSEYMITGQMNAERPANPGSLGKKYLKEVDNYNRFTTLYEVKNYINFIQAMNKLRHIRNYIEAYNAGKTKIDGSEYIIGCIWIEKGKRASVSAFTTHGDVPNVSEICFRSADNCNLAIQMMGHESIKDYFGLAPDIELIYK